MNFGLTELLVILAIAALVFGTRRLRSLGGDLGSALKGFRKALNDDDTASEPHDSNKVGQTKNINETGSTDKDT